MHGGDRFVHVERSLKQLLDVGRRGWRSFDNTTYRAPTRNFTGPAQATGLQGYRATGLQGETSAGTSAMMLRVVGLAAALLPTIEAQCVRQFRQLRPICLV